MVNEDAKDINSSTICQSRLNDRTVTGTLNQVNRQLTNLYEPLTSYASTSYSLNANASPRSFVSKTKMFQVRRTFLLIVTFDLIFMALLWIIWNQLFDITVDKAFRTEVMGYTIKNSLFDIVGLSGIRFVLLMIPYAILRWSHWIFVAFTTLGSTGFIIAKTCVFTIDKSTDNSANYILLIVSFIIAWIEIWFFDYRVIPHERRLKGALNQNERRPLLNSLRRESIPPILFITNQQSVSIPNSRHQSFYSPLHSVDGSDTEEINHQPLRNVRSDSNLSQSILGTPPFVLDGDINEDYEKQAEEILDEIWRIYKDDQSWSEEAKSNDGLDTVVSKTFPKWGKMFRLISTVTGSRADIVEMLFERQEDIPKWSSSVNDFRILEVINNNLYITYQLTNEQAHGFIAKRDFVNITARRFIDDIAVLAAQACLYPQMPPKDNCVRAENGPTAYVIEKIDETTCKFTWILNVDLKGWIPQYLINSSLASVQLDLVESLRNYIDKTTDLTSSIDDNTS